MKRGFAQWCAAYANLIPGVGPLRYARAAVNLGNWVNWSAQFIPPHVMKRISQTPIGRLLYGQNTVAYWTSVGAKIARIIQHMDFEGTLRQALEARLAGDDAKAEALEYCATMARHALEDGVLLTYNQQLADDYLKGGLQRLFDKYHLKYDDDRRHLPIPAKIAKRAQDYRDTLRQRLQRANAIKDPKRRMAALAAVAASPLADLYRTTVWESAGFLSEYQSMMVKLAGWAYLHHESAAGALPTLPTDPASAPAADPTRRPAGAPPEQPGRGAAPHQPANQPISQSANQPGGDGGVAYDANRRRQIALYAADRAGRRPRRRPQLRQQRHPPRTARNLLHRLPQRTHERPLQNRRTIQRSTRRIHPQSPRPPLTLPPRIPPLRRHPQTRRPNPLLRRPGTRRRTAQHPRRKPLHHPRLGTRRPQERLPLHPPQLRRQSPGVKRDFSSWRESVGE